MDKKLLIISLFLILSVVFGFSFTIIQVNGDSMKPVLNDSDYFICNNLYHNISENDIIVYDESSLDYTVSHKVHKKINETHYFTKGINNRFRDDYVVDQSEIKCVKFIR